MQKLKLTLSALFAFGSVVSFAHADYDVSLAQDPFGENCTAPVDYYMFSLSYSPSFCAHQRHKYGRIPDHLKYQCGQREKGQPRFGWVVHGLWPQNAQATEIRHHPRFCQGDLPKLPESLIEQYMPMSPGKKLLQGEWEKHGACAFNSAQEYFAKEQALYQSLNLPSNNPDKRKVIAYLKRHNPQLKNVFIQATDNEIRICYDKAWQPMNCPKGAL